MESNSESKIDWNAVFKKEDLEKDMPTTEQLQNDINKTFNDYLTEIESSYQKTIDHLRKKLREKARTDQSYFGRIEIKSLAQKIEKLEDEKENMRHAFRYSANCLRTRETPSAEQFEAYRFKLSALIARERKAMTENLASYWHLPDNT